MSAGDAAHQTPGLRQIARGYGIAGGTIRTGQDHRSGDRTADFAPLRSFAEHITPIRLTDRSHAAGMFAGVRRVRERQGRRLVLGLRGALPSPPKSAMPDLAAPAPTPALRLSGLSAPRGDGPAGLSDLDLELAQGDFLLVHGEAGAGKSTMLDLTGLVRRPGAGRVEILGGNPWRMPSGKRARLRRRIGLIRQDLDLIDDLTVEENAALPMRIAGVRPQDRRRDTAELLGWLGLADMSRARPRALNHDQRQRVLVARAVAGKPDLILADEPLGWMEPDSARRVLRLLLQLNRQGATLVIASRNPDLAPASRRLRLSGGRAVPEAAA